jgi:hypothetical protein
LLLTGRVRNRSAPDFRKDKQEKVRRGFFVFRTSEKFKLRGMVLALTRAALLQDYARKALLGCSPEYCKQVAALPAGLGGSDRRIGNRQPAHTHLNVRDAGRPARQTPVWTAQNPV